MSDDLTANNLQASLRILTGQLEKAQADIRTLTDKAMMLEQIISSLLAATCRDRSAPTEEEIKEVLWVPLQIIKEERQRGNDKEALDMEEAIEKLMLLALSSTKA